MSGVRPPCRPVGRLLVRGLVPHNESGPRSTTSVSVTGSPPRSSSNSVLRSHPDVLMMEPANTLSLRHPALLAQQNWSPIRRKGDVPIYTRPFSRPHRACESNDRCRYRTEPALPSRPHCVQRRLAIVNTAVYVPLTAVRLAASGRTRETIDGSRGTGSSADGHSVTSS